MNADPEELVLTRNTTEGLNMVLSGPGLAARRRDRHVQP